MRRPLIPLRDNIPSRKPPVVTRAIIAICVVVFLAQLAVGGGETSLVERLGMIPARVLDPDREILIVEPKVVADRRGVHVERIRRPVAPPLVPAWLTLLTCIFLHGGWLHLLGNVWFLHIFGDNVEDRLGHAGYLVCYLSWGVAASLAHLLSAPDSTVPTIGASGAIAGVMGAYMRFYPRARVLTLVPIFFFFDIVVLPAVFFLGLWFVIQLFQGTFSMAGAESGGVAWWAHIGGFVLGYATALVLEALHRTRPAVAERRPGTEALSRRRLYPRR